MYMRAVLVVGLAIALAAVVCAVPTRTYANCVTLGEVNMYYTLAAPNVQVALETNAPSLDTWVSVAVSPSGQMGGPGGADYALGYVIGATPVVRDMYRAANSGTGQPIDDGTNSLTSPLGKLVAGVLTVEFDRPLAGTAPQDLPYSGTAATSVIWAKGSGATSPAGPFSQHSSRGAGNVNLAAASTCTPLPVPAPPGAPGPPGTSGAAPAPPTPGSWCSGPFCVYFLINSVTSVANFTIEATATGWAAFGLADERGVMAPADVYIAWIADNGQAFISDRSVSGYSQPNPDATQNVQLVGGSRVGGKIRVTFTRPLNTNDANDRTISDANMNIIYAVYNGPAPPADANANVPQHTTRGSGAVNFFTGAGSVDKDTTKLKNIHGILMVIAWIVLVPFGTLVARFFKNEMGVWWFRVHVGMQSFAAVLTFVAFFLGLAAVPKTQHLKGNNVAHKGIGLFIFLATFVQVLLGVIADRMWKPSRTSVPVFPDLIHWIWGYLLLFLAFVQCCLGFKAFQSPTWVYVACILFWFAWFGAMAILQILKGGAAHASSPKQPAAQPDNFSGASQPAQHRPAAGAGAGAGARPPVAEPALPPGSRRVQQRGIAQYDFAGANADELNLREGDEVSISILHDDGWATGTVRGCTGAFPIDYVKIEVARPAAARPTPPAPARVPSPAAAARPSPAARPAVGAPPPGARPSPAARPAATKPAFAAGDRVQALFAGDGNMYPATIVRMSARDATVVFEGYEPDQETVALANIKPL